MEWLSLLCCSLLAISWILPASAQQDPQNMLSYDEKFITGVKEYAQEKWSDAIFHISQAMEEYQGLQEARLKCFKECAQVSPTHHADFQTVDVQLQFFLRVFERGSCIRKCEESIVGMVPWGGVTHYALNQLRNQEGYNYLQLALFKAGRYKEAARAITTFSYLYPHDITVRKSMSFYRSMKQLSPEDMESYEAYPYRDLFAEGHRLYYMKDWEGMVQAFEDSLKHFYSALDECKTQCDGPMRYSNGLEFSRVIRKLYLERLECRVHCVDKLGDFREDRREDYFGVYFHYLQQGYFYLNQSLSALQASAAHSKLEPTNESAERNSVFYLQQPGVTRKDFKPREDVTPEVQKREADLNILKLYKEVAGKEEDVTQQEEEDLDERLLEEDFQQYPVGSNTPPHLPLVLENVNPVVVQTSEDHDGVERMVVDELLTEKQCQELMHLASFGHEGDGYQQKSPHTNKEKFEGLHILDAAKRAVSGEIDSHLSWLYLNSSSVSKDVVARQFSLSGPLYFSYTHLVCRTALEGMQDSRKDLSHPVHSDNCIMNEMTGDCDKVRPAYTWRDYSAILYLNDDFEGGDFFFAHSVKDFSPDVKVKPKCGRLVGFSAGKENMHGVTAVTKGRRCAVALWFTMDAEHKESSFDQAADLLQEKITT